MTTKPKKIDPVSYFVPISPQHVELMEQHGGEHVESWHATVHQAVAEHVPTKTGNWTGPVVDPWEVKP